MTTLGELTKLLDQGYLDGEYLHSSKDGDYKFVLKTISPLDEISAQKDADRLYDSNPGEDDRSVYVVIETLSRSILSVNGIPLEQLPGSEGSAPLEKKRSLVKKFSQKLLVAIWAKYQEIRKGTQFEGGSEESEAVKK